MENQTYEAKLMEYIRNKNYNLFSKEPQMTNRIFANMVKNYLEEILKGAVEGMAGKLDDYSMFIDKSQINNVINYLSQLNSSSNVMGICSYKKDDIKLGNRILILENIQDPGNLGTIIRSAVAFNIDTIILSNDCVDIYNPKVIRASQGMIFHIDIIKRDLLLEIPKLQTLGYQIIGTKVTHGQSLKDFQNIEKFAIIMGNEGNGMTKEVAELCDSFIYIEMNDKCESLNVAIATSIILYELSR